jgi:glycine/serine hydroxymethyltransferase
MGTKEMKSIASLISRAITKPESAKAISAEVAQLCKAFPVYPEN